MTQQLEISLMRSSIGLTPNQRKNLLGLGLFHRHQRVILNDTSSVRGMVMKVIHLVDVSRAASARAAASTRPMMEIIPPATPVVTEPSATQKKKMKKAEDEAKVVQAKPAEPAKKEAKSAAPKATKTTAKKAAPKKKTTSAKGRK
ncbi:MAG TPA: 50S ribosomal protein L30 [Bdellovibrionota bacterium]|nr:50S ribosomal protein L30 [Bdellovibrionota bacterium]